MILIALVFGFSLRAYSQQDSLLVMFWNVENFFDYRSENKPQYWTKRRFQAKCDAVAKTLLRVADRYGRLPDAVGFAEVENAFVLRQLVSETALRKLDYRIVHYESPDHRGIDCALLCRRSTLPLRGSAPKHVPDSAGGVMATRDILLAEFDSLAILVNHHPSQLGGKDERRELALSRLRALTDSLRAAGQRRTLAVGDFNQDLWGLQPGPVGRTRDAEIQREMGEDRRRLRRRLPARAGGGIRRSDPAGGGQGLRRQQTPPDLRRATLRRRRQRPPARCVYRLLLIYL